MSFLNSQARYFSLVTPTKPAKPAKGGGEQASGGGGGGTPSSNRAERGSDDDDDDIDDDVNLNLNLNDSIDSANSYGLDDGQHLELEPQPQQSQQPYSPARSDTRALQTSPCPDSARAAAMARGSRSFDSEWSHSKRNEVEQLKLRIKSRRGLGSSSPVHGEQQQQQHQPGAGLVTPSPLRRVRSNPLDASPTRGGGDKEGGGGGDGRDASLLDSEPGAVTPDEVRSGTSSSTAQDATPDTQSTRGAASIGGESAMTVPTLGGGSSSAEDSNDQRRLQQRKEAHQQLIAKWSGPASPSPANLSVDREQQQQQQREKQADRAAPQAQSQSQAQAQSQASAAASAAASASATKEEAAKAKREMTPTRQARLERHIQKQLQLGQEQHRQFQDREAAQYARQYAQQQQRERQAQQQQQAQQRQAQQQQQQQRQAQQQRQQQHHQQQQQQYPGQRVSWRDQSCGPGGGQQRRQQQQQQQRQAQHAYGAAPSHQQQQQQQQQQQNQQQNQQQQQRGGPPGSPPRSHHRTTRSDDSTSASDHSSTISTPSQRRDFAMLATSSPADGLMLARDGPHATIVKLRRQLDEVTTQNERSKGALARSDAVILELRKNVRELRGNLSRVEGEKELTQRRAIELESDLGLVKRELTEVRTSSAAQREEMDKIKREVSSANQRDTVLGELQLKLDRAEGQILTSDMRNREAVDELVRVKEESEMALARKEDEIDKLRQELGREVAGRKDAEELWKRAAGGREERVRELEEEIGRLGNEVRYAQEREVAVRAQRELDQTALEEVNSLREDLDEAAQVLDETREALNDALDELTAVKKEKDRVECERDMIREEMRVLSAKLEQELAEKGRLVKERNALREEKQGLMRDGDADVRREVERSDGELARREAKIGELALELQSAREEARALKKRVQDGEEAHGAADKSALVRAQMEKAAIGQAKRELEAKNGRMTAKITKLETERDELKRCLDDAMNELELADTEAKDVHAYRVENVELGRRAAELDSLIAQRDKEIEQLRSRMGALESQVRSATMAAATAAARAEAMPRTTSSNSRSRIEERRKSSETKLRALMGQVATSIDRRNVPEEHEEEEEREEQSAKVGVEKASSTTRKVTFEMDGRDGGDNVVVSQHKHVEELKIKLQTTEETLEVTKKELDDLRQQKQHPSDARGFGNRARTRSADAATSERDAEDIKKIRVSLEEERRRAEGLEEKLSATRGDLRARDESCADLRQSLREAVTLLKPLKDHVAQAEKQKDELRAELDESKERIANLEKDLAEFGSLERNSAASEKLRKKEEEVAALKEEVKDMEDALLQAHAELSTVQGRLALSAADKGVADESSSRAVQASNQSSNEESDTKLRSELQKTQDDLKTRRTIEKQLKQMLKESQEKQKALTQKHEEAIRQKDELKRQLEETKESMTVLEQQQMSKTAAGSGSEQDTDLQELRQKAKKHEQELKTKEEQMLKLREELRQTQVCLSELTGKEWGGDESENLARAAAEFRDQSDAKLKDLDSLKAKLEKSNVRVAELEAELSAVIEELEAKDEMEERLNSSLQSEADLEAELSVAIGDLKAKEEAEKMLNTSLKEAVEILKPLQGHVETAEKEKKALMKKLSAANKRIEELEMKLSESSSSSSSSSQQLKVMDKTVQKLEAEKLSLEQRVLELERESMDMERDSTRSAAIANGTRGNDDVQKLQEKLVEMESKYRITKKMLDQSAKTNASLLQDLKEMEDEEEAALEEMELLRNKLKKTEEELDHAKYIATTALVKVESMSVNSEDVSRMSGSSRHLPEIAEEDDAETTISKLEEEVRRARIRNDKLEASIRKKDQMLMAFEDANAGEVSSEVNTDVSVSGPFSQNKRRYQV